MLEDGAVDSAVAVHFLIPLSFFSSFTLVFLVSLCACCKCMRKLKQEDIDEYYQKKKKGAGTEDDEFGDPTSVKIRGGNDRQENGGSPSTTAKGAPTNGRSWTSSSGGGTGQNPLLTTNNNNKSGSDGRPHSTSVLNNRALPSVPRSDAASGGTSATRTLESTALIHSGTNGGTPRRRGSDERPSSLTRESSASELYATVDKGTGPPESIRVSREWSQSAVSRTTKHVYAKVSKGRNDEIDPDDDNSAAAERRRHKNSNEGYDLIDDAQLKDTKLTSGDRHQYEYPQFSGKSQTAVDQRTENFYSRVDGEEGSYSGGGSEDPYSKIPSETGGIKGQPSDERRPSYGNTSGEIYEPGYAVVKEKSVDKAGSSAVDITTDNDDGNLDDLYSRINRNSSVTAADSARSEPSVHQQPPSNIASTSYAPPPYDDGSNRQSRPLPPPSIPPSIHPMAGGDRTNFESDSNAPTPEPSYRYITVRESLDTLRDRMQQEQQRRDRQPPYSDGSTGTHDYATIGSDVGYEVVTNTATGASQPTPPTYAEIRAEPSNQSTGDPRYHSIREQLHSSSASSANENVTLVQVSDDSYEYVSGVDHSHAPPPPTSPIPPREHASSSGSGSERPSDGSSSRHPYSSQSYNTATETDGRYSTAVSDVEGRPPLGRSGDSGDTVSQRQGLSGVRERTADDTNNRRTGGGGSMTDSIQLSTPDRASLRQPSTTDSSPVESARDRTVDSADGYQPSPERSDRSVVFTESLKGDVPLKEGYSVAPMDELAAKRRQEQHRKMFEPSPELKEAFYPKDSFDATKHRDAGGGKSTKSPTKGGPKITKLADRDADESWRTPSADKPVIRRTRGLKYSPGEEPEESTEGHASVSALTPTKQRTSSDKHRASPLQSEQQKSPQRVTSQTAKEQTTRSSQQPPSPTKTPTTVPAKSVERPTTISTGGSGFGGGGGTAPGLGGRKCSPPPRPTGNDYVFGRQELYLPSPTDAFFQTVGGDTTPICCQPDPKAKDARTAKDETAKIHQRLSTDSSRTTGTSNGSTAAVETESAQVTQLNKLSKHSETSPTDRNPPYPAGSAETTERKQTAVEGEQESSPAGLSFELQPTAAKQPKSTKGCCGGTYCYCHSNYDPDTILSENLYEMERAGYRRSSDESDSAFDKRYDSRRDVDAQLFKGHH